MGYGPKKWDETTISRLKQEGRGIGCSADYKPWIDIRSLSSEGNSHRILGIKTKREHHLLSNVERDIFMWTEWSSKVIDIREQYPLDRDITLQIAAEQGIRHPHYPGTHVPAVMTLDFLITVVSNGETNLIALNAKREEESEKENSLQKLEIMRRYCEGTQSQHHIILHSKIPQIPLQNIRWIRGAYLKEGEIEPCPNFYKEQQQIMSEELAHMKNNYSSLIDYCTKFDIRHGIKSGMALRVIRMLMFNRVLKVDLYNHNLLTAPMASFVFTSHHGKLRIVN